MVNFYPSAAALQIDANRGDVAPRDDLDAAYKHSSLARSRNDPTSLQREILHELPPDQLEWLKLLPELDLDGQEFRAGLDDEIDLRASLRPLER
jgi:hypothetical protein